VISYIPEPLEVHHNFNFIPLYKRLHGSPLDFAHHSPITEWNFNSEDMTIEGVVDVLIDEEVHP
jgi:hypothetical protein